MTATDEERFVATRTIEAPASAVFAVLTDPRRHQETEPSDWVRSAVEPETITEVGQIFGMNMFLEQIGGAYVMHNRVTVFDEDTAIAWEPGQFDDSGELSVGGWFWRYDLEPRGEQTDVTLTYDWSGTPQEFRDEIGGLPPFGPDFLHKSLVSLDSAATS